MPESLHIPAAFSRRISVAPMMDWTDRHCRHFLRQISRHTLLYTEMVTSGAILHGPRERLLAFHPAEHPVALQLGGSDPAELAECARIGADYGYDEINLNCGCPSDRVQSGRFGACLMAEPALVAECVAAMRAAVSLPVTVKTRIGIDEFDTYEFLHDFVARIAAAGCEIFIIHARKAWLKGLSPKENREVPPLRYDVPARLKADFPQLQIVLNGGVKTLDDVQTHLQTFDGVMIGREAYSNPLSAGRGGPAVLWRGQCARPGGNSGPAVTVYRNAVTDRCAAGAHDAPHVGSVPGRTGRAPLAALSQRTCTDRASRSGCGPAGFAGPADGGIKTGRSAPRFYAGAATIPCTPRCYCSNIF